MHDATWFDHNKEIGQTWFIGMGFLTIGLNYIVSSFSQCEIQKELNKYYGAFLSCLGGIFTLHYTGTFTTTTNEKLAMLSGSILVIFIVVIWSGIKQGLFKNTKKK